MKTGFWMTPIKWVARYVTDRRGAIALAFAAAFPVIVASVGLALDFGQAYLVRQRLASALDASALAGAAAEMDEAGVRERIEEFFTENYPDDKIGDAYGLEIEFEGDDIQVSAYADYETSFIRVLGVKSLTIASATTIRRTAGANIELALVLDISNSMNNNGKIDDLIEAANSLVDTVVYEDQTKYYSKIAIVPYGVAVNAGSYAVAARGAVTTTPRATITGATRANPIVITAAGHGFSNDQKVFITGVNGMTQLNNRLYTVKNRTANTFQLYNAAGSATINGTSGFSSYSSGGTGWCTVAGCQYYAFNSASGQNNKVAQINNCVSERIGAQAYTDAAPSAAPVGRNYTSIGTSAMGYSASTNTCLTSTVVPLTSDKDILHDAIDGLTATGSTGGQVGVAWGWYMLSPSWGDIWGDEESVPAAYGAEELHKIMVLMTDGEYNSPHCNAMIAANATAGSGGANDHINCNATNGDSYSQSRMLCDGMKAAGVEIYAVGFQVDAYPAGEALMRYCATDEAHFFTADDGAELQRVFTKIAKSVSSLFISK